MKVLKNCGPTRPYPEEIGFSTARLTVVRKPRNPRKVLLTIAEDHG
jgi:hypothetical protein